MEELADGLYSKTDKQDIQTKKLREVKGQKMPMNMEIKWNTEKKHKEVCPADRACEYRLNSFYKNINIL